MEIGSMKILNIINKILLLFLSVAGLIDGHYISSILCILYVLLNVATNYYNKKIFSNLRNSIYENGARYEKNKALYCSLFIAQVLLTLAYFCSRGA